ncbi:sulfotransferase [Pseudooceanicola sp.]|uniref:tetratricopeptide repeat-containing sulfotransferase family protein n=1 Tax=Pseudooceanicola sp. TaxID=1914328 RepID=UPI003510DCB4
MSWQNDEQATLGLLRQGRAKAAYKAAKKAMAQHKSHPVFPNLAGVALCLSERPRDGLGYFRKSLTLDPGFHDARRNLAQTLILLGECQPAEAQLARLLAALPGDAGGWYLLAQLRLNTGQLSAALEAADKAIDLAPGQARQHNLRGLLRDRLGQPAAALEDFERALALNPEDVETLVNISLPLERQQRFDDAMTAVRRAVALAPGHVGARLRLAAQLAERGAAEAARGEYATVLTLAPGHPEALEELARLNPAEGNADLRPRVVTALKRATPGSEAQARLAYALARIVGQAGETEEQDRQLAAANATMARLRPFDSVADSALSQRILARFAEAPQHPVAGDGPLPIFVLGLPRSGTTLAEAVLGAHPEVAALGERAAAGILLYPLIHADTAFGASEIAAFRAADRALLPALPPGRRAYVDKMPENYRLIGFLKAAYPQARIVNLRRDPRDIALSMWQGHFSGRALDYTYDLPAMARRFNDYARMMTHWHRIFPGQILDLHYEALVADIDTASQALAEFCGLDWHPAMARPHQSATPVMTMSANQIRQPVHSRSVGGWRRHATALAPFIDGLDPALWPDISPCPA